MSAREELYGQLMSGGPHSPSRSEHASAFIDAFEREVQRADAALVRAEEIRTESFMVPFGYLADLIDPDVTS